ncbi:radical SAM protein [Candidatus Dependentiae bacterium]|nr:radical SAM protein [Candidatus Dependentiae bacterium]
MSNIKVNSNFHTLSEKSLFDNPDIKFQEYRRKWKENPEKGIVEDFPLFLDIEVTSVCNLKCPFCATTFRGNIIEKGFMKIELLKKIIDEGSEKGLYGCKFNIRGEPLLHKEIDKFVEYSKKKGLIDVYFNTNAQLLTYDMSLKLIDAGLDRISISIESYKKEIYEKYRFPGKFDVLLNNIESLLKAKKNRKVDFPKIRIQTVLINEVKNDLENYKNFWQQYCDEVSYLDYKEMKGKKYGIKSDWVCPELWQRMAVWWDGTILPCNHDDEGLLKLGDVNTDKIEKCWDSDLINIIRKKYKFGLAHEVKACDGCYLRDSEINKPHKIRRIE